MSTRVLRRPYRLAPAPNPPRDLWAHNREAPARSLSALERQTVASCHGIMSQFLHTSRCEERRALTFPQMFTSRHVIGEHTIGGVSDERARDPKRRSVEMVERGSVRQLPADVTRNVAHSGCWHR